MFAKSIHDELVKFAKSIYVRIIGFSLFSVQIIIQLCEIAMLEVTRVILLFHIQLDFIFHSRI